MKAGAITILTFMLTGLLTWGGTQILDHSNQLARLDEREKTNKELLMEVRADIKTLLIKSK